MSFAREIARLHHHFKVHAQRVKTETWQSMTRPEFATYELQHVVLKAQMSGENLDLYRSEIGPNLPWADDHFEKDRVCGEPLNPGLTWRDWPYSNSADKFRDEHGQFNHSYAERYWPKYAGALENGILNEDMSEYFVHRGIRYQYGDLMDVVKQIAKDPMTRQAILPVFFPEDTGAVHGGRVPCSLAYQFLIRNNKMDISYWLRSCDFKRHFADDVYLTVRLLLWVLQEARKLNPDLNTVVPGTYMMLMTSLHVFVNDAAEFGIRAR